MKKLAIFLVSVLAVLSLCACNGESSDNETMIKQNCDVEFGILKISLSGDWKQATDAFLEEYDYMYGEFSRSDQDGFKDEAFFLTGSDDDFSFITLALSSAPEGVTIEDIKYNAQQQGFTIQDATVDERPAVILTQNNEGTTTNELIFMLGEDFYSAWTINDIDKLVEFSKMIKYNIE